MNKKTIILGLVLTCYLPVHADVYDQFDRVKERVQRLCYKARYCAPYVLTPLVGLAIGTKINGPLGAGAVAGWAGYSLYSGSRELYSLKKKYKNHERQLNEWHNLQSSNFYFARWRQLSEGDGSYWGTPWQIDNDFYNVKEWLLHDIYAGRFQVNNKTPLPDQLLQIIRDELQELAHDKNSVAPYTDVYYAFNQPEEFHPDVSYKRFLWPTYNVASRLYIELDVMMKRLQSLIDVVASIRKEVGSNGWPRR